MTTDHPADDCWLCKARAQFEPMGYSLVRTDDLAGLRTVQDAASEHGVCTCAYFAGYPRGERHAPECDHDPDLRAALEAKGTRP